MIELFLVRHGQAAFGTGHYDRLSDLGLEQSALLGHYFRERNLRFEGIFSGTLRRHRETLEAMALETTGEESPSETDKLNEYDLGDIIRCWRRNADKEEKKHDNPADAFYYLAENALNAWTSNCLPGTKESWKDFNGRVLSTRDEVMSSSAARVLIITSGGPISALLRDALQLSFPIMIGLNLELANASITRLVLTGERQRLVSFNSTSHLEIAGGTPLVSRL